MRRLIVATLFALILLTTGTVVAGEFPNRACETYTKIAETGMLPIGTVVDIVNYEVGGPVIRTGTVVCYYVAARLNFSLMLMDAQAYVIDYGSPGHDVAIKKLHELTVR